MSDVENTLDSLVEALHSAVTEATHITEQQHIDRLKRFFNKDGTPKMMEFSAPSPVPGEETRLIQVPMICLAPMNSIKIDEMEVELKIRMDRITNGKGKNGDKKSVRIDSTTWLPSSKEKVKLRIKFASNDVPEGFSRLIENFIKVIP